MLCIFIVMKKQYIFLFFLFLAILPYCYLCFFANPSSDDFGFAFLSQNNEMLHLIKQTYLYYNGRYISNIFIYLNPIAYQSYIGYKIVPLVMIILFLFANFLFVNQFFYKKTRVNKILISLVLSLLFIHNMPIISEGIYWYTGLVIYTLGLIFLLFYVALLIKVIRENRKGVYSLFLVILLFFVCGFNEVLILLMVFFLAVASYIFYKKNLLGKKTISIQFLLSVLFAAAVIFSPGNELRGEAYPDAHNFSHSFLYSIMQVGRFSFLWIGSIPLIAASFIYFQINKKMREENNLFQNSFYINRWVSFLMLFAIIFICVFPAYWSTGILGQHRTLNVAYFFFIIIWFINLTVWFNFYQEKMNYQIKKRIKEQLFIFLLLGIMLTGNGYSALYDVFSGEAYCYNKQLTKRFQNLREAKYTIKRNVVLSPLTNKPRCLFVSDITSNPKDWVNLAYVQFFKLEEKEILLENK